MRLKGKAVMTHNLRHLYQLYPQNYTQHMLQHQIQPYHYTFQIMCWMLNDVENEMCIFTLFAKKYRWISRVNEKNMFPVLRTARYFVLGRTKIEYTKNHGLKIYYQDKFMSAVKMLIVLRLVSISHGTKYLIGNKWMFSSSILKIELNNPAWQLLYNERLKAVIRDHFSLFFK